MAMFNKVDVETASVIGVHYLYKGWNAIDPEMYNRIDADTWEGPACDSEITNSELLEIINDLNGDGEFIIQIDDHEYPCDEQ